MERNFWFKESDCHGGQDRKEDVFSVKNRNKTSTSRELSDFSDSAVIDKRKLRKKPTVVIAVE